MKQTTLGSEHRSRTHLFMLRVWKHDLGDEQAEWRGQVKHVMSGEVRYFRDWTTLIQYLKGMLSRVDTDEATGTG